MTIKTCTRCHETKSLDEFGKMRGGKNARCKRCMLSVNRAWRAANPATVNRYNHANWLRNKYGLTVEQYDEMYSDQAGACACCGDPIERRGGGTHVEHCHDSGRVFSLTCHLCNHAVGKCLNSETRALKVAAYIRRTRGSDVPHR